MKFLIGFLVLFSLAPLLAFCIPSPISTSVRPEDSKMPATAPGIPVRIAIPRINVDSLIESVGLTPEGELGVPAHPTHAGWFVQSPRPGLAGNSIIDGHYGWVNDKPAAFDDLNLLGPGDKIIVTDEHGSTTTFIVTGVQRMGLYENASRVFIPGDAKSHLNLITCQGAWSESARAYSSRLVVFSDREAVQ